MQYIADFHLHSKYSRATSKQMDLEHLDQWGKIKGIQVLGTGDFTHPAWFDAMKSKLTMKDNGFYQLKDSKNQTYFTPTSELSCIYKKGEQTRRIHLLILAPDLGTVKKINKKLDQVGNIKSDGRPIFGLDAKELTKIILDISEECLIIPAHIWTPWFSLFGSKSGFDTIKECFEELTPHIHAIETGLSSDPPMNWLVSQLDKLTILSNSDAHSPENLGREANVFELNELSRQTIYQAIKEKDSHKLQHTIEFYPEEGKYHWDGHRQCNIVFSPDKTIKHKGICPHCRRPLTVGVMNRVIDLSDRQKEEIPKDVIPYKSLIPLKEIIADAFGVGKNTKKVDAEYTNIIKQTQSEFNVLLDVPTTEIEKITLPKISEGIQRVRDNKVIIEPGYDGVYGQVKIFSNKEKQEANKQATLF